MVLQILQATIGHQARFSAPTSANMFSSGKKKFPILNVQEVFRFYKVSYYSFYIVSYYIKWVKTSWAHSKTT